VLTRALGFDADLALAANEKRLWSEAEALLPAAGVEAYTQGLMDLGATVCLARKPNCPACPLAASCVARAQGTPQRYPVKTRRLKRGRRENTLLWVSHGDALWLTQRPSTGVWAGLWSLPEFGSQDEVARFTENWSGTAETLPSIEHVLTHFDWVLRPVRYELTSRSAAIEAMLPQGRWVAREDALQYGLPAPVRKLLARGPGNRP
jgi:A/G-specific adenine glycosylase